MDYPRIEKKGLAEHAVRPNLEDYDRADVLAWTTQNRIGFLLAIVGLTILAFARAERREKMLGG